jgi:hypothetical protein
LSSLALPEDGLGGNMDGGHTQAVIIEKIKKELWQNFEDPKEKQWGKCRSLDWRFV